MTASAFNKSLDARRFRILLLVAIAIVVCSAIAFSLTMPSLVTLMENRGKVMMIIATFWIVPVGLLLTLLYLVHKRLEAESKNQRVEEALMESEERFRTVVEANRDAMVAVDSEGRIILFNPAAETLFGRGREEMLGNLLDSLVPEEYREECRQRVKEYFKDGQLEGVSSNAVELPVLRGDGEVVSVEASFSTGHSGNQRIVLTVLRDITERKRFETALRQATKMEAIGQLAGGIAHDFNNLLTGILGYSGMLKLDAEAGSTVREVAETIEKAAERAAGLIQQLLGFARRGKNQELAVDLHQTIHDVVALLGRTIDKNIRITLDLKAPKTVVMGDPVQLQQILLNLVINSRDAMPEGGDLTFHTDLVELDQDFSRDNPGSKPGTYFLVAVRDTGCGIPKDIQSHIFEPFFTTKEPGHGTGMGLAMVYGTVKNHEGYIQVCSEVGKGTSFNIYLPFAEEDALQPGEEDGGARPVGGKGRILLVDDEEVVRDVATAMLGSLGYEILIACNGREAVEIYHERAEEITLVILDMVMPEMGGRDCFRALKKINPEVKAILSTGYAKDGKAQETLDEGMVGFIQKPYRMTEISEKVHEALLC